LRGLRIVVDAAHGAGYHIAPHVLHELGAEVISIGVSPNGMNINDHVGATAPAALAQSVREHRADLGIALDGDADRLVIVDNDGVIYDGDQLLYAIAATQHQFKPVDGVVGTLMSNLGLEKALNKLGIAFARANVGDRYVLEQLKERGLISTQPATAWSARCKF
jgi:phosphoglucosamine mutase